MQIESTNIVVFYFYCIINGRLCIIYFCSSNDWSYPSFSLPTLCLVKLTPLNIGGLSFFPSQASCDLPRPFLLASLLPSWCAVQSYRPHLEVRDSFEAVNGCTAFFDGFLADFSEVFFSFKVNVRRSVYSPQFHLTLINSWQTSRILPYQWICLLSTRLRSLSSHCRPSILPQCCWSLPSLVFTRPLPSFCSMSQISSYIFLCLHHHDLLLACTPTLAQYQLVLHLFSQTLPVIYLYNMFNVISQHYCNIFFSLNFT